MADPLTIYRINNSLNNWNGCNVLIALCNFFGTPILSGALFCLVQAVINIKKTINIAIANNGILFSAFMYAYL